MRKLITIMIIFIVLGCAKSHIIQHTFTPDQIYHIHDIKKVKDMTEINNSIFYLEKGDIIPLKVSLDSKWFSLKQSQVDLIAQYKLYFRLILPKNMSGEKIKKLQALDSDAISQLSESEKKKIFQGIMLHVSQDAQNWAPLNQLSTLKEALGIAGGSFSFGVSFNAKDGLWSNFLLQVTQKPEM